MVGKTRKPGNGKTPKPQNSEAGESIVKAAKAKMEAIDRELAVAESDLKRAERELMDEFGVDNITEVMAKVEEMNAQLPDLQQQRDQKIIQIQEFLEKVNG